MFKLQLIPALLALQLVSAAPLDRGRLGRGIISSIFGSSSGNNATSTETPTTVSNTTIDTFVRPALFAQTAYCSTPQVESGSIDTLIPGVEILQAGGNDGTIPLYYIAYDNQTQSIVLAHQGTDARNILSIANDAQFVLTDLNMTLIPNPGNNAQVHDGFQKTFERTAPSILSGVKNGLASKGVNNVLVVGHSLGAAVATMGAVMLRQQLPSSVNMNTVVFGLPRGGNQAWADLVNAELLPNFNHFTNQNDPVPTVPPRFLDYVQPENEVHIRAVDSQGQATDVVACPGQENEHCSEGNSVLQASVANHIGPYFHNISMSSSHCALPAA